MANNDIEKKIGELLHKLSEEGNTYGEIYEVSCVFFIIANDEIWEIPNDAGGSPKGGWFPDIVAGPTVEEDAYLRAMMEKYDFDECFFKDYLDDCMEYDEDSALEYFEETDEDVLKTFNNMLKEVKSGKTPFATMEDFVSAVGRYGLDSGWLYYDWEGEWIDFYENIAETGEERGYYDNLSDEEWLAILENLDKYKVQV